MPRLPPISLSDVRAELCRRSFKSFFLEAWKNVMHPGVPLDETMAIDAICVHLEAVAREEIRRLLINMPPRHLKTELVSIAWPAWVWTWRPTWKAIFATYSHKLTIESSVSCRNIIESDWYQDLFVRGAWELASDSNQKDNFHNTLGGQRFSSSVEGSTTGYGGNVIVADDPQNPKMAASEAERNNVIKWWQETMSSRLDDARTGSRVVVQQRLEVRDVSAHLLETGDYVHLSLPAEFDPGRRCVTPLWRDPRTEAYEPLSPVRFPPSVLAEIKRDMPPHAFGAQYNQNPISVEGSMLRPADLRFWKKSGDPDVRPRPIGCDAGAARVLPDKFDDAVIAVDANFKEGDTSDFCVMTVWVSAGADMFLLEMRRGQWSFARTLEEFSQLCRTYPAAKKWVEAAANGHALVSVLQREIRGLAPQKPQGSKEARAQVLARALEGGNCFVPDGAPWVPDLVAEFAGFPGRSRHDDIVDSSAWAAIALSKSNPYAQLTPEAMRRVRSVFGR